MRALSSLVDEVYSMLRFGPPGRSSVPDTIVLLRRLYSNANFDRSLEVSALSFNDRFFPMTPTALQPGDFVRVPAYVEINILHGVVDDVPRPNVYLAFDRVLRLCSAMDGQRVGSWRTLCRKLI